MTPLFQPVPKSEFEAFVSSYEVHITDGGEGRTDYLIPGDTFTRNMVAFERDGAFFILNDLGKKTLGEPLPLEGDE